MARYKKHVVEAVAAATAANGSPLSTEQINAMVVEDRVPHLSQIEASAVLVFSLVALSPASVYLSVCFIASSSLRLSLSLVRVA